MKYVVSAMDTITTFSMQEIIRQNKCQMSILDNFALKQDVDKILQMNTNKFSMMESPSTSDDDEMDNTVSKPTIL